MVPWRADANGCGQCDKLIDRPEEECAQYSGHEDTHFNRHLDVALKPCELAPTFLVIFCFPFCFLGFVTVCTLDPPS